MLPIYFTWRKIARNVCHIGSKKAKNLVNVAFSNRFLLFTNISISITLSSVGDVVEQHYEIYTKELEKYDQKRTMHMAISGATIGILCHNWYKFLDRVIIGKSFNMVMKKLCLDQFVFSPVMLIIFFGTLALFEKEPLDNFQSEVRDKFVTLYQAEWIVWPPAQLINFYFLPTKYRVLYDNMISLGYDVYTSQVKHSKSTNNSNLVKFSKLETNAVATTSS